MDLQKISFVGLLLLLLVGCSGSMATEQPETSKPTLPTQLAEVSPKNPSTCLEEIHLSVGDSVLVYWVKIAKDSVLLEEHAGNFRWLITQSGKAYYNKNKEGITDLGNYFNDPLSFYKQLSAQELTALKDSLQQLKVYELPALVAASYPADGGTVSFLYVNDKTAGINCSKIELYTSIEEQITTLFKHY